MTCLRASIPPRTPIDRGAPIWPESRYLAGNTHIMPYIPHLGSESAHTLSRDLNKTTKTLIQIGHNVSKITYSVSV